MMRLDEAVKTGSEAEAELKEERDDHQLKDAKYKEQIEDHKKDLKKAIIERLQAVTELNQEKSDQRTKNTNYKQHVENLKKDLTKATSERDKAVADLQVEKSAHESKKASFNNLTNRVELMSRVLDVGAATIKGRKEMMRRYWNGSIHVEIEGRGTPDRFIIDARNVAVHEGDVRASNALFLLGVLDSPSERAFHKDEYGWEAGEDPPSVKLRDIANMKGTMFSCYSWTKHSHSGSDDNLFLRYYNECRKIYDDALTDCSGNKDSAAAKFDSNSIIPSRIRRMKQIMDQTVKKERARRHDH